MLHLGTSSFHGTKYDGDRRDCIRQSHTFCDSPLPKVPQHLPGGQKNCTPLLKSFLLKAAEVGIEGEQGWVGRQGKKACTPISKVHFWLQEVLYLVTITYLSLFHKNLSVFWGSVSHSAVGHLHCNHLEQQQTQF